MKVDSLMRTVLGQICIFLLVLTSGCSNSTNPESDLVAHLSLSIFEYNSPYPFSVDFVLDASGTISRLCPTDSLEVRWDLDGDGLWDSDFEAMHVRNGGRLPTLPSGVWSARCEVRDCSGNVSTAEESISLPERLPLESDLVVGDLIVNDNSEWSFVDMDTIPVGSDIRVSLPARFWGNYDSSLVPVQIKCLIDGELVSQKNCVVAGPYAPQSNIICRFDSLSVLDPGVHSIEFVYETTEGIVDSNIANNGMLGSRVFVSAAN